MTYKYIKFTDSQTMRSLEKVAIDKGWIKPKEIVKEASIDEKILVSENMDENFANLIIGLKKAGFKDLSNELQHNFIEYKKAESKLYDLENNPGEDLINKAHPGKSPNIGKGELSLIESLYEQHEKMMDAVNSVVKKKANIKVAQEGAGGAPTAIQSNDLGAGGTNSGQPSAEIKINELLNNISVILKKVAINQDGVEKYYSYVDEIIYSVPKTDLMVAINYLIINLQKLKSKITGWFSGIEKDYYPGINSVIDKAINMANQAVPKEKSKEEIDNDNLSKLNKEEESLEKKYDYFFDKIKSMAKEYRLIYSQNKQYENDPSYKDDILKLKNNANKLMAFGKELGVAIRSAKNKDNKISFKEIEPNIGALEMRVTEESRILSKWREWNDS